MVVGALAIATVSGLIQDPRIQDWSTGIRYTITVLFAAGYLGLLASFVIGLPSLAEAEAEPEADPTVLAAVADSLA